MDTKTTQINRRSANITEGKSRAPNRSMYYAMGYQEGDFKKPMVGVANGHSTITPCNSGLQKLADAAVEGNTPIAIINLRNALATGTDPVLIVSALASSFRTLAKVSGASRSVKSFELAQSMAIPPWQIDKARRQLVGWSENAMAKAVIAIAAADAEIKGAAADPIYALERAIMTVCAARGSR